ncbi:MAG TPA: WecB/TagA/CpsF family glycosyltransferase, partial [Candidatus Saccharimonadales bacterium]|nr:WecB/TagA/CpsF family glycosyltransferase [Candidatus Saccharimonadales bacterium]
MWGIGYNAETDVLPDFPDVLSDLQSPQPALTKTRYEENLEFVFPPPILLLGVPFAHVQMKDAVAEIERMIGTRKPHYVVTANVDFLVQSMHDEELHRIMLEADQVVCDGTPLIWSSRLLGNPLPERVAGADLVPLLLSKSAEKGYRIFFLGGEQSVAERAVENVRAKYPGVQICGHYSPPFKPLLEMDHDDIIARVQAARPDILLV